MSPSHITLLAPVPPGYPTGGFEYNRRIAEIAQEAPGFCYRFVDDCDLPPGGIVILDSLLFSDASAVNAVEKTGNLVGWLVHALGSQLECGPTSPLDSSELELLARSDFAIAPSRYMANHIVAEVPDLEVGIVRPGVDPREIPDPKRSRLTVRSLLGAFSRTVSDTAPVAVTVGSLSPVKNQMAFLPVLAELPQLFWVVVGSDETDPAYTEAFHNAVLDLSLVDRVVLVPPVTHDVALQYIAGADVYIQPSSFESYGMALAEARAAGTATVASNVGGAPEAAGGDAVFCNPDDIRCWAASIAEILPRDGDRAGKGESPVGVTAVDNTWRDAGEALLQFLGDIWEARCSSI